MTSSMSPPTRPATWPPLKVRTVGVDYLSVGGFYADGPETHHALLSAGVWIIEGMNFAGVDPGRYQLICLPLRIQGADGAPARVILQTDGILSRHGNDSPARRDERKSGNYESGSRFP